MKRSMKSLLGTALVAAALAAPAQAEIGRHTFKVSNGAAEDHPVSAGIKGMSECLADKTDGKMKLRGFYNGELGDDAEATQSVRSGSIEMVVTGAAAISRRRHRKCDMHDRTPRNAVALSGAGAAAIA